MSVLPDLAPAVDYAFWDAAGSAASLERACADALRLGVRAVAVASSRAALAYARLEETPVKVIALVGFPLGNMETDAKRFETEVAVDCGAHEIEMVLNVGLLKDANHKAVLREIRDVVEAADERPVCVALETQWLTPEEIDLVCDLVLDSGARTVANTSGYWPEIAPTVESIHRLRELVGEKFAIKAAGHLQNGPSAAAVLKAGASRLGLSPANLPLVLG